MSLVRARWGASVVGALVTVLTVVPVLVGVGWLLSLIPPTAAGGLADEPAPAAVPTRMPEVITADTFLSVEAVEDLVGDLEAERGDAIVFGLALYDEYAVLDVPEDARGDRSRSYYWDGELRRSEALSTSSTPRVDLAALDPAVVVRGAERAGRLVGQPDLLYVLVYGPDDDGVLVTAYAQAGDQGGYVAATARGKVVRRVTW